MRSSVRSEQDYAVETGTARSRLQAAAERVCAGLGLIALSPLLAALAVAVKLNSPGPILFRQLRAGLGGKDISICKFRTMTVRKGSEAGSFDAGDGSRVTGVGRFLRVSKLDELPQLWNVAKGDMALVGPRPEVHRWVAAYPERWAFVHTVMPGITDPAAIVYRHEERILASSADPERAYREEILPHKLRLYEEYVRTRSLLGDCLILARTSFAIVGIGRRNES